MFKIELETNEVNYVLNCIANRPYNECYPIMNKIMDQVKQQSENVKSDNPTE